MGQQDLHEMPPEDKKASERATLHREHERTGSQEGRPQVSLSEPQITHTEGTSLCARSEGPRRMHCSQRETGTHRHGPGGLGHQEPLAEEPGFSIPPPDLEGPRAA